MEKESFDAIGKKSLFWLLQNAPENLYRLYCADHPARDRSLQRDANLREERENLPFIMIISKDYMSSICCKDEWSAFYNKALHNKKCRIYPLIIDDSNPPTLLSPIMYLRVSDEAFPEIFHQLLGTLKR